MVVFRRASSNLSTMVVTHIQSEVSVKSESAVTRFLSCIVRCHCKAMTCEYIEDLAFAVVICRVYRLVKVLKLSVVMSYKHSVMELSFQTRV
jgi:hypothetical protein